MSEFLGLKYQLEYEDKAINWQIITPRNSVITIEDHFFNKYKNDLEYLSKDALPTQIEYQKKVDNPFMSEDDLPVLIGSSLIKRFTDSEGKENIYIGNDIFAASFFMLSRWEEKVNSERDIHNRFPGKASIAYKFGFIQRPIVNEYVEFLWNIITDLVPECVREKKKYSTIVSCDVDLPYKPEVRSIKTLVKYSLAQLIKHGNVVNSINAFKNFNKLKGNNYSLDKYRTRLDWMMSVNEKKGNRVAFYFIPYNTSPSHDYSINISNWKMINLFQEIEKRGHEIGIHPGYYTYNQLENFSKSVREFISAINKANIKQNKFGGRQHYLRWEVGKTENLWESSGLTYDSTMGYADIAGFRCGVCYDYSMFSLKERKQLNLKQRPLILMECTVLTKEYMGLSYSNETLSYMLDLKNVCKKYNGNFTLLWHNSFFENIEDESFYLNLI